MMETMREMQFTIEKDAVMFDYFEKLDSQVKVRTYVRTCASRDTEMYRERKSSTFIQHILPASSMNPLT